MPYIPKEERVKYDHFINNLAISLKWLKNDDLLGQMNYVLFRLAGLLTHEDEHHNYARMAVVSSALAEAQAEFRRRILAPYEDKKIKENGDVEF